MGIIEENDIPLLQHDSHDHQFITRTGSTWTAVAHIITGLIGSGVLSLGWSMAQLGWVLGIIAILFFAFTIVISSFLLSGCYLCADDSHPLPFRNTNYVAAVNHILGEKYAKICVCIIHIISFGGGVAYTITTAICLRSIRQSICYHNQGHDAHCEFEDTPYIILYGATQIFMSLIPDFHSMEWVSTLASIMAFVYSSIALGLCAAKVLSNGYISGSIQGVSTTSGIKKMWLVSQASGDIAFSYTYAFMFFEIQDTLKSPPSPSYTMKKAGIISVCITTFFYLTCGGVGYAAFGDQAPGDVLTGFSKDGQYFLINLVNVCVAIHLIGAARVCTQPTFSIVDKWIEDWFPESHFRDRSYTIKLPFLPSWTWRLNLYSISFRTVYAASITIVAIIFPYFNLVLGMIGTINYYSLSICFPVEMHLKQRKIRTWTTEWIILRCFNIICLLISMFLLTGAIQGIVVAKLS